VTISRSIRGTQSDEPRTSARDLDGDVDADRSKDSDSTSKNSSSKSKDDGRSPISDLGERLLRIAEDVVYVVVAGLLVVGAVVLLGDAASKLGEIGDGPDAAVLALLDRLLLVFVLVELIFAVRMTLTRREIVAEPFLIVGIIASIKEIILLSVEVANVLEGKATTDGSKSPEQFAMLIALLGLLVVVLAASAVLLRMKERQPVEGKRNEEHKENQEENS
jgi:uncharacterized membrane protein (DUF373 family)